MADHGGEALEERKILANSMQLHTNSVCSSIQNSMKKRQD